MRSKIKTKSYVFVIINPDMRSNELPSGCKSIYSREELATPDPSPRDPLSGMVRKNPWSVRPIIRTLRCGVVVVRVTSWSLYLLRDDNHKLGETQWKSKLWLTNGATSRDRGPWKNQTFHWKRENVPTWVQRLPWEPRQNARYWALASVLGFLLTWPAEKGRQSEEDSRR